MKKLMLVFGTRPEAIKMAPLVKALKKEKDWCKTSVCVTGQHREMLDQVLEIFEITPDYDLRVMSHHQDLFDVTCKVLQGMREIIREEQPDLILVHGDTTTSMVSALSAYYMQIPVAHVEAGLRTYNINSPWPEELNRQISGRISVLDFAPTAESRQNLLNEGIPEEYVYVTGNTVIDALLEIKAKIDGDTQLESEISEHLASMGYDPSRLNGNRKLVLITGHRRENFGRGFLDICNALKTLAHKFKEVDFVYPMHLNPNVRTPIQEVFGSEDPLPNMFFIEPLDYLHFVYLMSKSYLILTDSGGIQEEAPGLGKPVLVMRDTTERPEALKAGTIKLVGTDKTKIEREVTSLLTDRSEYEAMSQAVNPYGDGHASEKIVEALRRWFA